MPKAITCVRHGKWKLYWTGWRYYGATHLILVAQWYALANDVEGIYYASHPGNTAHVDSPDLYLDITRYPGQILVLPSTPHKTKCEIKAKTLLRLVECIDARDKQLGL